MSWHTRSYGSGTRVVVSDDPESPHFYIYAGYSHNEGYRDQVSDDLCEWLNGGRDPVWRSTLKQASAQDSAVGNFGISLRATGPMRLPPNDNGRCLWQEVDADSPKRRALILMLLPTANAKEGGK